VRWFRPGGGCRVPIRRRLARQIILSGGEAE